MPQGQRPQKIGDENNLAIALQDKKIINSSTEDLSQILRKVMMKIGLRSQNWPTELEKLVLIEHIVKEFGGNTLEEIKLAFDMAISGKLNCEINCYENFSCLYFSGIMKAYREWSREAYNHLPKKVLPMLEENKSISDEEMQEWIEDWKTKIKKVDNPVLVPPSFYQWLIDKNVFSISNRKKIEYLEQAVSVRQYNLSEQAKSEGVHGEGQGTLNEFNVMRNKGVFEGKERDRLLELAKKIIVFDYLKNESYEMRKLQPE